MIYDPAEDSYLLQKYVEQYSKVGRVLDIGTGSGIQAITAAKQAKSVVAVDIDDESLKYAKKQAAGIKNIEFVRSDLFEKVKGKFDLIVFNPPYLPEEGIEDKRLFSGKHGTELTIMFLDFSAEFLEQDGVILLIGSSHAKQIQIKDAIEKNMLEQRVLEMTHIFFEDIIIYEIRKSDLLKKMTLIGISGCKYLTRGQRGVIFTGEYKGQKVAIKTKRETSTAMSTIENEERFLEKLNRVGIGPTLIMNKEDFFMYKFVEGVFIDEFLKNADEKSVKTVIKKLLMQMHTLDKMGINKFEMNHPHKHIIIEKDNPVLIDFERCRYTEDPKNVTQFLDFLSGEEMMKILKLKGIDISRDAIISISKEYKDNLDLTKISTYLKMD